MLARLSLTARLIVGAGFVLLLVLGLTAYTLDAVFRDSVEEAILDRLRSHVWTLIAVAEIGEDGSIRMPKGLPEAPFYQAEFGLYAQIESNDGRHRWISPSLMPYPIPNTPNLAATQEVFQRHRLADGQPVYLYSFGVSWGLASLHQDLYTVSVAEDLSYYQEQVGRFRRYLFAWMVTITVILLTVQGLILRWSLRPLRRAADELKAIQEGRQTRLQGKYPKELKPLTDNLNGLIRFTRENLRRYRNTLADLAHSLNTPLAVLRAAVEGKGREEELRPLVAEQVERMSQIVSYQLNRAATAGRAPLNRPVSVCLQAERLGRSLAKVYQDKQVAWELRCPPGFTFAVDEGDLMELLGNLMENAFKWCRSRVRVTLEPLATGSALLIQVEDDGPGIPEAARRRITRRGQRADRSAPGFGIGLAVVAEMVVAYGGTLDFDDSDLGGAKVQVVLPQPGSV